MKKILTIILLALVSGSCAMAQDTLRHASTPNCTDTAASSMEFGLQEYVEGNYGLVPQGLEINPAWHASVTNTGASAQSGLTVTLKSASADQSSLAAFASRICPTLPPDLSAGLICDHGGWLDTARLDLRGWYGFLPNRTPHSAPGSAPLPNATPGEYLLAASIANGPLEHCYDTMYYRVTAPIDRLGNPWTWGHDNGVLAYTPHNYWHDTDAAPFAPGYTLTSRYSTGTTVPECWVIRGMELVASPVSGYCDTGVLIEPVLLKDLYTDSGLVTTPIATGASALRTFSSDINDSTVIGWESSPYLPYGSYNTATILFPQQPEMEPNTSYRVGYRLTNGGRFAVAQEAQGYCTTAPSSEPAECDTIWFGDDSATKRFAHYMKPNKYQTMVTDSTGAEARFSTSECNPMIRLLVGPAYGSPEGIHESNIEAGNAVIVRPNPAGDWFVAEGEGIEQAELYDAKGALVRSGISAGTKVDLSALPSGVYYLRVIARGTASCQAVIKR